MPVVKVTSKLHRNNNILLHFCPVDLWNVYGECENYTVLKGHSGCVLELSFSPDGRQVVLIEMVTKHYWIYMNSWQSNKMPSL